MMKAKSWLKTNSIIVLTRDNKDNVTILMLRDETNYFKMNLHIPT